jgi:RNA polymerase sigma-70 factor (ECF subfamily)
MSEAVANNAVLGHLDMFAKRKAVQQQYEMFLKEHLGLLYRVAGSYEADTGRREDLLQEIVIAIWQASARFAERSSFKTFALRIAHNRAITHCTKAARAPDWVDLEEDHSVDQQGPEAATEKAMQQEALLAAVRHLPLTQRQIVGMALEGLSYNEIAEVMDISVSNVGVRLNRARSRLQEIMNV